MNRFALFLQLTVALVSCHIIAFGFNVGPSARLTRLTRFNKMISLDAKPSGSSVNIKVPAVQNDKDSLEAGFQRPRPDYLGWDTVKKQLSAKFGYSDSGKCFSIHHRECMKDEYHRSEKLEQPLISLLSSLHSILLHSPRSWRRHRKIR